MAQIDQQIAQIQSLISSLAEKNNDDKIQNITSLIIQLNGQVQALANKINTQTPIQVAPISNPQAQDISLLSAKVDNIAVVVAEIYNVVADLRQIRPEPTENTLG